MVFNRCVFSTTINICTPGVERGGGGASQKPVDEFSPRRGGDKVDYGIGLSYRPSRLHWLAGRYDNPMPESITSPSQGLWIVYRLFFAVPCLLSLRLQRSEAFWNYRFELVEGSKPMAPVWNKQKKNKTQNLRPAQTKKSWLSKKIGESIWKEKSVSFI